MRGQKRMAQCAADDATCCMPNFESEFFGIPNFDAVPKKMFLLSLFGCNLPISPDANQQSPPPVISSAPLTYNTMQAARMANSWLGLSLTSATGASSCGGAEESVEAVESLEANSAVSGGAFLTNLNRTRNSLDIGLNTNYHIEKNEASPALIANC